MENRLSLTTADAATEDEINLLKPHLIVTVKVAKQAFTPVATPQRDGDQDVEEDGDDDMVLGIRTGEGVELRFQDYKSAAKWFQARKDEDVVLSYNRDDSDPYAASAEVMHKEGGEGE